MCRVKGLHILHDGVFTEEVPLLNSDPCKLRISAMNWLAEGTHPNGGNMGPRLIIDIVRIDSKYDVHLVSELVLENGTLYGARHPWLDDMGMVRFTQTSRTLSYDGGEQYEYTLRPNTAINVQLQKRAEWVLREWREQSQ